MALQSPAVILVGVGQEEGIDVEPSVRVELQSLPKLSRDIGVFGFGVVGRLPDIAVDQDALTAVGDDEHHVAVADAEMGGGSRHVLRLHVIRSGLVEQKVRLLRTW